MIFVGRAFTARQAPRNWAPYGEVTLAEADHTARFIAGCYGGFSRFEVFAAYSMFYFAAASHAEIARRVGVQPAGARFLAAHDESFAAATRALSPAFEARVDARTYERRVAAAIDPLNIAGFCDPGKRNWYGVDPGDVVRGAAKLGVSAERARQAIPSIPAPTLSPDYPA